MSVDFIAKSSKLQDIIYHHERFQKLIVEIVQTYVSLLDNVRIELEINMIHTL